MWIVKTSIVDTNAGYELMVCLDRTDAEMHASKWLEEAQPSHGLYVEDWTLHQIAKVVCPDIFRGNNPERWEILRCIAPYCSEALINHLFAVLSYQPKET